MPKFKEAPVAANATMWMASTATSKGAGPRAGIGKVTTVNQEILRYLQYYFGGFCVFLFLISVIYAWRGEVGWRSPLLIFIFLAVNLALYQLALRASHPLRVTTLAVVLGSVLCPVTYLLVDGVLAPWWPGYAVMCFGAAVAWGLHTSNPLWSRLVLAYYLINMILATWLGKAHPNWDDLAIRVGVIGIVGLILIQLTVILSQSLSKVYERSVQHRKAKEELQELGRLKTEFFANISHEFRTPITLTLAPLEASLKGRFGELSEELRHQVDMMTRNQKRLLNLINQILDVSKAEAGAIELRAALIPDLNRFVQERVEQFRTVLQERGIDLRSSFDPLVSGMELYIDQEKFDKILNNLLSNAMKFTKKGYIQVTTEIRGDRLLLTVADSGIGIKEAELPHVFDRFRQADGSATREFAGTGLGLALVQEFTKLHGGEVTLESRYGEGTTFKIEIPIGKGHLTPQSIVDFVEDSKTAPESSTAGLQTSPVAPQKCVELNAETELQRDPEKPTVLLTEDNPDLLYFLRELLRSSYNVFVAGNGLEGFESAEKLKPDLILSDMMMPVMSGADFCKKIRETPALRATPFILLTARTMLESKIEGLELGADDYLTKPFSESELLARVKNLVILRQQQLKLKRELEAARAIQFALLPTAPQRFDGVDFDFHYYPSEDLSGDFCDVLREGPWVYFYLADVTSHGTASAQVTYLLKEIFSNSISHQSSGAELSLSDLMLEVQRRYADHHLEYDVAIQVGRYHLERRVVELLRGNAPSPLRVSPGSPPQLIPVRPSPPLSARNPLDSKSVSWMSVELKPGDSIYFFTDGCYEFPVAGREFGLKRFHELLGSIGQENWKQDLFEALVKAYGGRSFPDDVTFFRLRVL